MKYPLCLVFFPHRSSLSIPIRLSSAQCFFLCFLPLFKKFFGRQLFFSLLASSSGVSRDKVLHYSSFLSPPNLHRKGFNDFELIYNVFPVSEVAGRFKSESSADGKKTTRWAPSCAKFAIRWVFDPWIRKLSGFGKVSIKRNTHSLEVPKCLVLLTTDFQFQFQFQQIMQKLCFRVFPSPVLVISASHT